MDFAASFLGGELSQTFAYKPVDRAWSSAWNETWGPTEFTHPWDELRSYWSLGPFGFSDMMENVAASMTKYARNISNETALGTAMVPEVYVAVDWVYVALPVVLIALGIVFFVCMIMANTRQELSLWKSSVLPMIYYGPTEEMETHGDGLASVSSLQHSAQEMTVKLEISSTQKRLMVQNA